MLILYVHAHMHVGTRVDTSVWLAPTCEWVYTRGKGGEKERSQRSGGRSIVIPTNPSFQHARSRRIHSDNDDNDDNGDNDEYDERSGVPSLSLSLLPLPSSPLVVDTMVKSRGCSRRFLLSFSVPVRSSFASMRLVGSPLDRKSSSIVRFFRKLAVPVLFGSKGDYTWRRFFFREREKKRGGYDRSRNFSTASGAEFWPFWDEYRSGFGWRRRN